MAGPRERLRVLIVDDAEFDLEKMARVVRGLPNAELAGTCQDGFEALAEVERCDPDVVLLDVSMPGIDGLETLERLRKQRPEIAVVMISGVADSVRVMRALSLGAIEMITKSTDQPGSVSLAERIGCALQTVREVRKPRERPGGGGPAPATERCDPVPARSATRVAGPAPARSAAPQASASSCDDRIDLILIGISTGGPQALGRILPGLPPDLPPIVVVQHMAAGFTAALAAQLAARSGLPVREARSGDLLLRGQVLIAPGGRQIGLVAGEEGESPRLRISDDAPVGGFRPSVDAFWKSVAEGFDGRTLALVMTGMGRDGCEGAARLAEKGACVIAQDEASSVVWGMPGAVVGAGLAREQCALDDVGARIVALVRRAGD